MTRTSVFLLFLFLFTSVLSKCPDGYVVKDSNLVYNGDFSFGNIGFTSDYRYVRNYHWTNPQADPWGVYTVVHNSNYLLSVFAECLSPEGDHNPMLSADGHYSQINIWQQNVKVKPNTNYIYEANFSAVCCWDGVMTEFGFYANKKELAILASEDTCDWRHFSSVWNSGSSKVANLEIQNVEKERYGNDFVLDDVMLKECVKPEELKKKEPVIVKQKIDYDDESFVLFDPKNQIRLQMVQFQPKKPILKQNSFESLDAIVTHLNKVASFKAEFLVHNGIPEKTKVQQKMLSQLRANLIKKYLIDKGIDESRIKALGMGYKKPLRKDMRKESMQLNERVMVRFYVNENN